MYCRYFFF